MWKLALLIIVVILIILLLVNSPVTKAVKSPVEKNSSPKIIRKEGFKTPIPNDLQIPKIMPENPNYHMMEHHVFDFESRELHLVLYANNFDGYIKGFWKKNGENIWMNIHKMNSDVKCNKIPTLENLGREGNYIYFSINNFVLIYENVNFDIKLISTDKNTLPLFDLISSLKVKNKEVVVNNKKYSIINQRIKL